MIKGCTSGRICYERIIKKVHYDKKGFGFSVFGIYPFITWWNPSENIIDSAFGLRLIYTLKFKINRCKCLQQVKGWGNGVEG